MIHWVILLLSVQVIGLSTAAALTEDEGSTMSIDSSSTTTTDTDPSTVTETTTSPTTTITTDTDPSTTPTTSTIASSTTNTSIPISSSISDSTTEPTKTESVDPTPDSTTLPSSEITTDTSPINPTSGSTNTTDDSTSSSSTDSTNDSTTTDETTSSSVTTIETSTTEETTSSSVTTIETSTTEETTSSSVTTIETSTTEETTSESSTDTIPSSSSSTTTTATTEDSASPSDSTTTDTSTETSTGGVEGTVPQDNDTALWLGILIPVIVIGVTVILIWGYKSGRLVWPPKSIFSQTPDDTQPSYISLKKFPAHCDQILAVPLKLYHEFQLLTSLSAEIASSESFIAAHMPENKVKNRYINILPYDSTRVKLTPEGDNFFSDYINASYIKGYTNEIEYIATQGPKAETCRDFWRMVFQEPIKVIVMVTQLEEMGKPKCFKYFPNLRENMVLEDISVWCTAELHFPIYTLRTLVLTKDDRKRSISHLHFREWPDFGCPSTPDLMLQFCQVMRQYINMAQPSITLVHCSAGVGRTGTLIAVDILIQQINENKKISVFDTVYRLRKQRVNMVQSEPQYAYIYKCLKEALENPSCLSSENSSTTSTEPIYENVECARITSSRKSPQDALIGESECAL